MRTRIRWLAVCGALLAAFSLVAVAGRFDSARANVRASMVVTGNIDIAPDGTVLSYALDKPELLPEGVKANAANAIPHWRFAPVLVDGKAVHARTRMSLRIVARHEQGDKFSLRITSANFGGRHSRSREDGEHSDEDIAGHSMSPPRYPLGVLHAGITGTVFVVVRVGLDGTVEKAAVEQVNLRVIGTERVMRQARDQLADASLSALRRWTFTVPKSWKQAAQPDRDVRIPVDFVIGDVRSHAYGEWEAYVEGPRNLVPWLPVEEQHGSDALVAGGIYPIGTGPKLLTHLGGEAG